MKLYINGLIYILKPNFKKRGLLNLKKEAT